MALVGTAIVVGIVALPLAAYVLNEAANDYNEAVVGDGASQLMLAMEMNTWQLPPSVQPYSGSLFDRSHGKSVTRFYEPVAGVAVEQAAEDLVSALRRQGYNDLESTAPIEWAGSCSTTGDCRMRIEADGERARIVVALAA